MNKAIALSCCVLGLAACASGGGTTTSAEPAAVAQPVAARPVPIRNDTAYMARVERVALRRGIDLHWVNPPTRPVTAQ